VAHVFERLLLVTEHTPQDAGAEYLAMALARRCAMPLSVVLPLISNAEYESVAPELAARRDGQARSQLDELQARADSMGVTLASRARHGTALDREILSEALERQADLLILRRRGKRSLLARLLLGEMVGKVISKAPCSVLISPLGARVWQQRILLALAPSQEDEALVSAALSVAGECGLPLTILSVLEHDQPELRRHTEAMLARVAGKARQAGLVADTACPGGRRVDQVLATAEQCRADLIILGRRHGAAALHLEMGSVMQAVAGRAACPVLVHVPNSTTPTSAAVFPPFQS
jgi:nucleotide-binding universal stress UspA family protein